MGRLAGKMAFITGGGGGARTTGQIFPVDSGVTIQ